MPSFTSTIPHQLGRQVARERLNRFLESIAERYKDQISKLDGSWDGETLRFSFSTYGIKVQGAITIDDDQVRIDGEIPMTAIMFKGKIESAVREGIEKALAG